MDVQLVDDRGPFRGILAQLRTGPYHRYIFADPTNYVFETAGRLRSTPPHAHRRIIGALRGRRPTAVRRAIEADILSGDAVILPQLPVDPPERLKLLTRSLPGLRDLPAEFLRAAVDAKTASPHPSRSQRKRVTSRRSIAT